MPLPPEAILGFAGVVGGLLFGPALNARIPQDNERFSGRETIYRGGPLAIGIITSFAVHDSGPFWLAVGYTVVANSFLAENSTTRESR